MNKVFAAFVAGLTIGILYAPYSGRKTRRKISLAGNDIKEGWNAIADSLIEKMEDVKYGLNRVTDNAIAQVENVQFENTEPNSKTDNITYSEERPFV